MEDDEVGGEMVCPGQAGVQHRGATMQQKTEEMSIEVVVRELGSEKSHRGGSQS